jgi:hypothetical protein
VIEQLPLLTPDAARARQVSKRCHEMLTKQRRDLESAAKPASRKTLMIERAIVAGLCALYLSSVARDVVQLLNR